MRQFLFDAARIALIVFAASLLFVPLSKAIDVGCGVYFALVLYKLIALAAAWTYKRLDKFFIKERGQR